MTIMAEADVLDINEALKTQVGSVPYVSHGPSWHFGFSPPS